MTNAVVSARVARYDPSMARLTRRRDTALHVAVRAGDVSAVQAELAAGAEVDAPDRDGRTALHEAAFAGRGAIVGLDEQGNTPLWRAVFDSRGRGELITLLLRHGADRCHANRHGVTPEGLARTIANHDVRRWLGE